MKVHFLTTHGDRAGGVEILSFPAPKYFLLRCSNSWTNFPSNLPSKSEKIWRITLTQHPGIRLQIHCNGVEVANVLLSGSTCRYRSWKEFWSRDVEVINFFDNSDFYIDHVSDYYRVGHIGIGRQT